ncbi:MAG: DUF397 domain-containing protein [Streptomycetales bacterium]
MQGTGLSCAAWRKSSFSGADNNCVEVALLDPGRVAVRDSKAPAGPALVFAAEQWRTFVGRVRDGRFDLTG